MFLAETEGSQGGLAKRTFPDGQRRRQALPARTHPADSAVEADGLPYNPVESASGFPEAVLRRYRQTALPDVVRGTRTHPAGEVVGDEPWAVQPARRIYERLGVDLFGVVLPAEGRVSMTEP